jgi:threonyl-tRNA synthetase
MDEVVLRLPDGSERRFPQGTTGLDVARSIGAHLAAAAVAVKLDGHMLDLGRPIHSSGELEVVTATSEAGREVLRHSTAHVLAQAVLSLYPSATFAFGPSVADGFYYDFDLPERITDDDLERIEARMREIIEEDQPFERQEMSRSDALQLFGDHPYKQEIIESAESEEGATGESVSIYRNDGFVDLCRGPHVQSTSRLGHFTLMRVAGAYWRGDVTRPQLQRIYGTAWESKEALEAHLRQREEARRRDHRRLGPELDLFSFPEEVGSGLAVWHPKGGLMRRIMEDYSRAEHEAAGYSFVVTPHIAKAALFETSGHLQWYADSMYPPMLLEGEGAYYAKPMSCPFHILIYKSRQRSYRDLPMRLFELATVYRHELSGVVHGLLRARGFTQDDSHIFCTREQLGPELASLLDFVLRLLRTFGFSEFEAELATRPDKFVGDPADWDEATEALREAIESSAIPYRVAEGEGAFYAPKIDVHVQDAIGRSWQLSTLQVDFQLPHLFEMTYSGPDNLPHRPFMVHRALFGSEERFFGILTEHYAGAFPTWLCPLQVAVLPVAERHHDHVAKVLSELRRAGLRAEVRWAEETLGNRIRHGTEEKVPYMLILGDADVASGTTGVRTRAGEDRRGVPLGQLIADVVAEVEERRSV